MLKILLTTLLLLQAGCANTIPQGEFPPPSEWRTLPADYVNDYFFLPIALDEEGEHVLWFLYDTGSNITVIDSDSLRRESDWKPEQGASVFFQKIKCGTTELSNLSAQVQQLDHLQAAISRPFDGILAYGTFADALLQLDYPKRSMKIAYGTLPPPDNQNVFSLEATNRPFLGTTFAGNNHHVLIDSGSGAGFELEFKHSPAWLIEPRVIGSSMGIDGIDMQYAGRLQGIGNFLSVEYPQPLIHLADSIELIGTDILQDFALTFDQRTHRLHASSVTGGSVAPLGYYGTGVIFRPSQAGMEIMQIFPDSAAAHAGLKVGDVVERIESLPSEPSSGRPLRDFYVRRGGNHFHVEVGIQELIPVVRQ